MCRAALEAPEGDLDGRLPFVRPLPHVAVLADRLPHLFQDDDVGPSEAEEAEARGALSLEEKFGEQGSWAPEDPSDLGVGEGPLSWP